MQRSAIFSDDGVYRYRLDRTWGGSGRRAVFVLLNPSTADSHVDDPTLRRCIGFASQSDCTSLTVVNLFAFRATRPVDLWKAHNPVGPMNDHHIREAVFDADLIIAGWGHHAARAPDRVGEVLELLGSSVHAFAQTKLGHPRHPLYLRSEAKLKPLI